MSSSKTAHDIKYQLHRFAGSVQFILILVLKLKIDLGSVIKSRSKNDKAKRGFHVTTDLPNTPTPPDRNEPCSIKEVRSIATLSLCGTNFHVL